jgi:multiple sugar transport system substrate-binding protein
MTYGRESGSGVSAGRGMNRREFLKLGGAGLAGAALLGSAACGGGSSGGSGNLVFAMGRDTSGTLGPLVEEFNKQNKGGFKVTYRAMPTDSGQYFDKLQTEFQAGQSDIDVIGGDIIWAAQFAANQWVVDLSDRFPKSDQSKYLPAPIQGLTYDGKIWAVPWFTDAGMLFYRKDLLEKSGYSEPPKTWDQLKEMALKTKKDAGLEAGFVFQGDNYEGGVCNGLEYVWTHGGDVLDGDQVIIDSPETVAGLATERSMITDGVSPQAVSTLQETTTDPYFLGNKAVFARIWSYEYALAGTSSYPKVKPDQIGVASLPVGNGGPHANCLGGWNMYISALSDQQDEAWEFVKWMTGEYAEKKRAIDATLLPTLKSLYSDPELRKKVPTVAVADTAIAQAKPRPVSPYYSDMSLKMAEEFNTSLKGDISPEEAAKTLQKELESIQQQAE